MTGSKILLVDDEPSITAQVGSFLTRSGYQVECVSEGNAVLDAIHTFQPELIVLDILLPGKDGRSILRDLRRQNDFRPVILLTQIGESVERALALEEGADDYLNKPFDPHELLARIRAVLRRSHQTPVSLASAWKLTADGLSLDRRSRKAFLEGQALALKPKTFGLLEYLMTHPDEMLSRERLLDAVWGWDYPAGQRAVDTRVAELRRAIRDDAEKPRFIETAPGEGYRFIASVKAES